MSVLITDITATASSQYNSSWAAAYALDGDTSTGWLSRNVSGTQYLLLDLGSVRNLEKLSAMCPGGYATEVFTLSGSTDGLTYTEIQSGLAITVNSTMTDFTISGAYRYLKLTFTASNQPYYSIFEVDVFEKEETTAYKTSGAAVYSSTAFQSITNCRNATIRWNEDTPAGTSVSVSIALSATVPADTDYIACTNEGEIASLAGTDMSDKTLYIKVTLSTTDTTVTPSFSNLYVTAEDVLVKDYVPNEQYGVYKVYCDIRDKIHGITVLNKKTSRLRFASTSERVPVFSAHMFVEGQDKYIDGGYRYERVDFNSSLDNSTTAEDALVTLCDAIAIDGISESVTFDVDIFYATATDAPSIVLT